MRAFPGQPLRLLRLRLGPPQADTAVMGCHQPLALRIESNAADRAGMIQPWPVADADLVRDDTVTVAVQVSGKLRATIEVERDMDKTALEKLALANDNVQRAIDGKPVRKVVIVPNRIVNVVV